MCQFEIDSDSVVQSNDIIMDQISDATRIKTIVDCVIEHKEKLNLITQDILSSDQKVWLLAFEASEAKLAKMGLEQTKISTEEFIKSMLILNNVAVSSE